MSAVSAISSIDLSFAASPIAIGDAANDKSMLEIADTALIIRSRHHMPPKLKRTDGISISKEIGPKGWVTGVTSWLQNF